MPKIEVDEEELLKLRSLEGVIKKIASDPKRAIALEKLHKEVDPNVPTPRSDMLAPISAEVQEVTKTMATLREELATEKAEREKEKRLGEFERTYNAGFEKLRRDGWTDAGIEGVKKLMEERGITDHEIAAAYFEKLHPPQMPVTPGAVGAWNFAQPAQDDDFTKKLLETRGENNPLLDKTIADALADVRGPARR